MTVEAGGSVPLLNQVINSAKKKKKAHLTINFTRLWAKKIEFSHTKQKSQQEKDLKETLKENITENKQSGGGVRLFYRASLK